MQAVYVEPIKTSMTFADAQHCMKWALKNYTGIDPTIEVLALALAKTALETGNWQSIWNSNWGNVKCPVTATGMYTCITLNEVLVRNGKQVVVWFAPEGELTASPKNGGKLIATPLLVPEGHVQTRMKAFANNFDGVDCYVDFIANGRYKAAWAALLKGDASGYIHALKVAGYFTAPEDVYAKGVIALQNQFIKKIKNNDLTHEKLDVDWERLQELVPQLQFDLRDTI